MSYIKKHYEKKAAEHENHGGACKTILITGKEVKACVDENGQIVDKVLRQFAIMTGQN